ncbi:hypothetical protein EW146_g9352 [Bondarzewia mesenterica]|uniref:F-box domain-containing protein n=1 Tax=Bondarzewia mesenterica TaxID=1095465 RepID=A0A4S4L8Z1_9AGAM|nr:hypothetical protein EW146_g9352 [Bondarzewia mesenterica]
MTSTPCKLDLLDLPPEILEEIVTEILSRKTLLALSKSSRSLAALIIPHHLHFRVIRAPIFRSHLWERLARDGLHAANMGEEAGRPVTLAQATWDVEIEIETTLVSALRRIVHLNDFAWYHVRPPVLTGEDDIWSTLQRLGTVRNLDILDVPITPNRDGSKRGIILSDSFLRLSEFTTLKLHSTALNLDTEPDVTTLIDMLEHNCPDLESHRLYLPSPLTCVMALPAHPLNDRWFGMFISVTRTIFEGPFGDRGARARVHAARMFVGGIWEAQASVLLMRPIETLETLLGVEVHDTITLDHYFDRDDEWAEEHAEDPEEDDRIPIPSRWKTQFLARLRACLSIRHLSVIHQSHTRQLDILATVTPHLTRLDVTGGGSGLSWDIDEWCALYMLFPSLQTIAAGHLVYPSHSRYFQHWIQKDNDHI